jgi:peptide/nickel transport system permease protein
MSKPPAKNSQESVPQWQLDLDQVGFLRRLLLARKWYGGDWWFVLLSAILLLFFIILGTFPQLFAPYDPHAEVGPSLLAPGEPPSAYVLVVQAGSGIQSLQQVGNPENKIAIVVGTNSSQALREAVEALNAADDGAHYQPRPERFDTLDLALQAVQNGAVDALIATPVELEPFLGQYPQLEIGGSLRQEGVKGFILGTNQIGQDIFSRLIWGTKIALMVGLSSALLSVIFGVPLGLISGFIGGALDRALTLFMDSIYSFPGLILAIAISAVLGPGLLNIIIAIAVLYVPTYFRIVRGQTLSVKQELYVEAARSLGTKSLTILRKYILPNVIPSVVIIFSVNVADAILTEAGLSFIGLGLPPDTADWGIDLARGQDYLRRAWWLVTFPGLMVSMVTLSFSMLGESLSEILNPKLAEL